MSNRAWVTGTIEISPPIPWTELLDSPFSGGDDPNRLELAGSADRVLPPDEPVSMDQVVGGLQALADRHGTGRSFTGCLTVEGSGLEEWWQLSVREGKVRSVSGRVVFDDPAGGGPAADQLAPGVVSAVMTRVRVAEVRAAIDSFNEAADGLSDDDEHDAAVELAVVAGALADLLAS